MNILMIPTQNSGVVYWRMVNFWEGLHRFGLANCRVLWWQKDLTTTHPWETDITNPEFMYRISGELDAYVREADVIVIQMMHLRESLSTLYAIKDAYPGKPVLAEIDDDIINTPSYNPASEVYTPGSPFMAIALDQFRNSDGIIVSTPYLAEVYADYNKHIYVAQNCIDNVLWDKAAANRKKQPGIRIGWAGGGTHTEDLRVIEPVVHEILQKFPEVTFSFVHGIPEFLKGIPGVESVQKWSRIDRYPKFIADQDWNIALAPLVDNSFNRGKSNLRWLEAAALGIPCVASKVGHFKETINHGVDGMLCRDSREFVDNISKLITDRDLRKSIGSSAHARSATDFGLMAGAQAYLRAIDQAVIVGAWNHPMPVGTQGLDGVKAFDLLPEDGKTPPDVVSVEVA